MKKLVPLAIILAILGIASMVYWSAPIGLLFLAVAGVLGYAAYRSYVAARQRLTPAVPALPTAWADARKESRDALEDAEHTAQRALRDAVKDANRRGKAAVRRAAERVQAEQSEGWVR